MKSLGDTGCFLGGVVVATLFSLSGCMTPIYHQPQGFSSTYYRHLQQSSGTGQPLISSTETNGASDAPAAGMQAAKPIETADQSSALNSFWIWMNTPIIGGDLPATTAEASRSANGNGRGMLRN